MTKFERQWKRELRAEGIDLQSCAMGSRPIRRGTVRFGLLWLAALLVAAQGGCSVNPTSIEHFQSPRKLPRMSKQVAWKSDLIDLRYQAELVLGSDRLSVSIVVENRGEDPVFVLMDHPWIIEVSSARVATFTLGSDLFNYGNEVPFLTRLESGRKVQRSAMFDLNLLVEELNAVRVGFFGIFNASPGLVEELSTLDEVQGWWQTADIEIADQFLKTLVLHFVEFPLVPQKAEAIEPRIGIGTVVRSAPE